MTGAGVPDRRQDERETICGQPCDTSDTCEAWGCDRPHEMKRYRLMPAVSPVPDRQREAVADELGAHSFQWWQKGQPGWEARCSCKRWGEPIADDSNAVAIHARWKLHVADELLALLAATRDGEQA